MPGERISPAYLSHAISEAVGEDAVIFNEYPLRADHCPREKTGTLFALGPAGGLGWGLGAALGAKLAAPDKLIVATLGDGAYMFSNPTVRPLGVADAQVADPHRHLQQQPLRRGAQLDLAMFKDGVVRRDRRPASLPTSIRRRPMTKWRRHKARTPSVWRSPAELPAALARARNAVVNDKRQALLNVITPY